MKVIVPCGGRSSRYPGMPPKWSLPSNNGRPMIAEAVSKLDVNHDDLIITILKEHDEKYDARAGLRATFGKAVEIVVLDEPTASQPETVTRTLQATGLSEPFLVKDSDNSFALSDIDRPYNYVACESLNSFDAINPRNKSYIKTDDSGVIMAIREKEVISDLFSVGGYFFRNPAQYVALYEKLKEERATWQRELYTSDIIAGMILDGEPFSSCRVTDYQDWGTLKEWRRNLQQKGSYFILLDGFILERGNAHFSPRFADVAANEEAVSVTRELIAEGHRVVFISIRPESARQETEQQLAALGLPSGDILFDMPIGRYSVISAPHPTVPFTSANSLEVDPSEPRLAMRMRFDD
ncbi:hypothetical protein ASF69_11935 [Rhizobium sp. Leaf311]|uniref:hypothetical protein n=1 Tax=Rhizobium sp. Leaf311 TaxID=1736332 RepID=UPI000713BB12|nr:hypothetical protein [Rhizobium sp. Leaf311]KQQ58154.1 hypothetical protein ASF69_11935 [Rhizobium sp. Leaf311]